MSEPSAPVPLSRARREQIRAEVQRHGYVYHADAAALLAELDRVSALLGTPEVRELRDRLRTLSHNLPDHGWITRKAADLLDALLGGEHA